MSKIPGPPVGYTDLLDYEITDKLKKERDDYKSGTKKRYFPLRPSSAGSCTRRLTYELMEYLGFADYNRELNPPALYRLFELGHTIEYSVLRQFSLVKIVQTRYKQQTLSCAVLDAIDKETEKQIIEGSCDACFISDKYKCIMDVKSSKDKFSKIFPTGWTETLEKYKKMKSVEVISDTAFYFESPEEFMEEVKDPFLNNNIYQLNLYACSQFMKDRGIDHAVLYKYNKNDSRHYELRFKPSQALADKVESKFNVANKAARAKKPELAPQDHMLGSMPCAFCPFKKECWGDEDALRAWFKTFPKKTWPEKVTSEVGALFVKYEEFEQTKKDLSQIETEILALLKPTRRGKIELDNGHVYEVKFLKSPREHYELRRSKK